MKPSKLAARERKKKQRKNPAFTGFLSNDEVLEYAITATLSDQVALLFKPIIKKWLNDRPKDTAPKV